MQTKACDVTDSGLWYRLYLILLLNFIYSCSIAKTGNHPKVTNILLAIMFSPPREAKPRGPATILFGIGCSGSTTAMVAASSSKVVQKNENSSLYKKTQKNKVFSSCAANFAIALMSASHDFCSESFKVGCVLISLIWGEANWHQLNSISLYRLCLPLLQAPPSYLLQLQKAWMSSDTFGNYLWE